MDLSKFVEYDPVALAIGRHLTTGTTKQEVSYGARGW